jgi:hypothetical protein
VVIDGISDDSFLPGEITAEIFQFDETAINSEHHFLGDILSIMGISNQTV